MYRQIYCIHKSVDFLKMRGYYALVLRPLCTCASRLISSDKEPTNYFLRKLHFLIKGKQHENET